MSQFSEESIFKEFTKEFETRITQIVPDPSGKKLLVIAYADIEKQFKAYFIDSSDLSEVKSTLFSKNYSSLTAKAFSSDRIVMNNFSNEQNPDITDVLIFDWTDPIPQQEYPSVKLRRVTSEYISIDHPTIQGKLLHLDIATQTPFDSPPENQTYKVDYKLPHEYRASSEYFSWFTKLLKSHGVTPKHQVEYLKVGSQLILSVYSGAKDNWDCHLYILNDEGQIVYDKKILTHQTKLTKDKFFVIQDSLLIYHTSKSIHSIIIC